jgi:hypothetical protein
MGDVGGGYFWRVGFGLGVIRRGFGDLQCHLMEIKILLIIIRVDELSNNNLLSEVN